MKSYVSLSQVMINHLKKLVFVVLQLNCKAKVLNTLLFFKFIRNKCEIFP